jgi:DNA-binding NtrC family response regulator
VTETQPRLVVLTTNHAFATLWAALAESCGVPLVVTTLPVVAGDDVTLRAGTDAVTVGHRTFRLPDDQDNHASWLRDRFDQLRSRAARVRFTAAERTKYRFDGIVGTSAALTAALASASRVIPDLRTPVMLTGENGTGKALMARAIHYEGPRQSAPFVEVDCAATSATTLFGHERKPGLFELAAGGTLLLNAITNLAAPLQESLLRAIDEGAIRRVGASQPIEIDVRTVAASHLDLADAVERGVLREDLHRRFTHDPITLPPLRARRDDIIPLTNYFVQRFAAEYDRPEAAVSTDAQHALTTHDWPGNVRELRSVVERTLLLSTISTMTLPDIM